MITFETLKKRQRGVYRAVPVPSAFLDALDLAHGLREGRRPRLRLWPWHRATAWRKVKAVMDEAGIADGPQKTPKGLRHG